MKKIFCLKCDQEIILSESKLSELRLSGENRLALVCPNCTHQLRIRLRQPLHRRKDDSSLKHFGHIVVLENGFGYKQYFPLRFGLNHIGRRNKDTVTDLPIVTGDPSMDRHHAIIRVSQNKQGQTTWALADNSSRVGTFVANELLSPKEWYNLSDGDIFTLGATTIIFSVNPIPIVDEAVEGESLY